MLARARAHQGALWLLIASSIGNVLAYGYQVLMARLLRPEDYAILTALFGVILVESIGAQVIQSATARIAASYKARDEQAELHAFVRRWTRRIVIGAGIPSLLLALGGPIVGPALGVPVFPASLLGVTLFLAAATTFTGGLLQGLGLFGWLGWNLILQSATRLGVGVSLVLLGTGIGGAFSGAAAAILVGLVAGAIPLRELFRAARGALAYPALGAAETRFFLLASLVLIAYAALTNMDAVLVRALLSPEEAGSYAGAITMAKVVLFAPIAVGFILLERTARSHAHGQDTERALYVALAFVAVTSGTVALAYNLAPASFTAIVVGSQYPRTAELVGLYGVASLSNALLTLWNAYFIGRGEMRIGVLLAAGVVVQLTLLVVAGHDAATMVRIVLGVSLTMQAASIAAFVIGLLRRPALAMRDLRG